MKKQFKRSSCILFMTLLTATMLSACSSEKKDEAAPKQEVQQTEVAEQEVQDVEVKEEPVEEEPVEEKPVVEPESEIESEPEIEEVIDTIPEGVDLESDVPGEAWVESFNGVVEEPLFIVFNDESNKKAVARDGQSIQYKEGDTFVVYTPLGSWIKSDSGMPVIQLETINGYYNKFTFDMEYFKSKRKCVIELEQNGETTEISCSVEPVS